MKKSYKAVIRKKKKILVLFKTGEAKTFRNVWDLPGGKQEEDETGREALRREALEETGLKVKILSKLTDFEIKAKKKHRRYYFYECSAEAGKITLSREHNESRWVEPEELEQMKLHPFFKKLLKHL